MSMLNKSAIASGKENLAFVSLFLTGLMSTTNLIQRRFDNPAIFSSLARGVIKPGRGFK